MTLTQQAKEKSDEAARKVDEITADIDGAMLFESSRIRGTTQIKIKEMGMLSTGMGVGLCL